MSSRSAFAPAPKRDLRGDCLCLNLQRAARSVARRFDDAFRRLEITSGQFSLLMALNRAAAPSIGEVSTALAMDRTTLTANLKPLARRGLIEVRVDAEDKRSRRIVLTASGRTRLARALPVWQRTHAAVDRLLARSPDALRADLRALS
jgi:DNA-binding MarR family transcriptional regulator